MNIVEKSTFLKLELSDLRDRTALYEKLAQILNTVKPGQFVQIEKHLGHRIAAVNALRLGTDAVLFKRKLWKMLEATIDKVRPRQTIWIRITR